MSSWFTACECITDDSLMCHIDLDECECECECDDCDDILEDISNKNNVLCYRRSENDKLNLEDNQ